MTKRIFLIRHGESEGNANKTIYASKQDYLLNLTDLGKEQAYKAGYELAGLMPTYDQDFIFFVSPFERAKQTLEQVILGLSSSVNFINPPRVVEDPRIREQDFGHYRSEHENRLMEMAREAYGTFFYRINDGESGADVYDRVSSFLDSFMRELDKPDTPDNVVIVAHGMLIRIFLMRWYHWSYKEFENVRNPHNGSIIVMERDFPMYDPKTGHENKPTGKYTLRTQLEYRNPK